MATKAKYADFESAIKRLEEITDLLESGDPKLEEAIKLYTEGLEIAKLCDGKLGEVEKKIKIISEKNGILSDEDFVEE